MASRTGGGRVRELAEVPAADPDGGHGATAREDAPRDREAPRERPLPGSIVGTGSLRGAQTERRTPDPTVVGPILQATCVAPQREIGPARGFPAGEGDRPREGRDRGEAAELGTPQVRESPAH